ncbi:hypothetical protein TREPR_0363 [Treponema primitia ZAS-2]|uniref:Uncharacterized protein n=1 Tax=Treponema primitia (strain ATCC BAA-887 / DSM 12427 / ZAS-2) TaxID=545694 RepID=F5YN21_TREPZ|nr:hypothetical protein TREPR_0363 [Treponema primitia ZAS-2]
MVSYIQSLFLFFDIAVLGGVYSGRAENIADPCPVGNTGNMKSVFWKAAYAVLGVGGMGFSAPR